MKRIGVVYHPLNKAAFSLGSRITELLKSRSYDAWLCSAWDGDKLKKAVSDSDLIITAGGDGTILRVAQAVLPAEVPILSVNLGKLGFLTELAASEALEKIPAVLDGNGWIDERAVLEIDYVPQDPRSERKHLLALNDAVMARGGIARVICAAVKINDELFGNYKGDGVIVATATGSTGYSYAAGGPVLYPAAEDLVLTPILPHLTRPYSVVLPRESRLEISVSTNHQATLCADGHINIALSTGDHLFIKKAENKVRFIRLKEPGAYYRELDAKLRGNFDTCAEQ